MNVGQRAGNEGPSVLPAFELELYSFINCTMANTRFEYVKHFELDDTLLPGCWIVIRLDGKGFTK